DHRADAEHEQAADHHGLGDPRRRVLDAGGPLTRRDPVQVPAFVAEESGTRDQPRTLVLGGTSPGEVAYTLVRGSGARLGDAELTAGAEPDPRLDDVVAHLVAGSGADQTEQLSGYAIRYVLVRDGAPRQMGRVLDSTPGLSRLSQLDGSALWRVDREIARVMIVPPAAETPETTTGTAAKPADGTAPVPVAAGPVEAHTEIPAGPAGRVLRLADRADEGWTATLDGKELTRTTVDGWAQGFELPAQAGRLDLTYDQPLTRSAWIWAQVGLAVVLLVLALPGRRREIDDDLPEEGLVIPAQATEGDGRRARRLRAAAEAEAEGETGNGPEPSPATAAIPGLPGDEQPRDWDGGGYDPAHPQPHEEQQPGPHEEQQLQPQGYAEQGYYQEYAADPYQQQAYAYPQQGYDRQPQQYDPQAYPEQGYEQQPQQYDPQQGQYGQQGYEQPQQPYDPQQYDPYTYGYGHPQGHETEQRPDGSSNQ
ncbi:family 2 glycosyl transferase, partial [Streptomyces sp. NPDC001919]